MHQLRLPKLPFVLSVIRPRVVGTVGVLAAVFLLVDRLVTGFDLWTLAKKNWRWLLDLPEHGWFWWLVILAWFAWIWWAALRREDRDKQVAEAETAVRAATLAELRAELDDLMGLPLALASLKALEDSYAPLSKALGHLRDTLSVYREKVDQQKAWVYQQKREPIPPKHLDTPACLLPGHADRIVQAVNEARQAMGDLTPFHSKVPERPPLFDNLDAVGRYVAAHDGLCMGCADELNRLGMSAGNISREIDEAKGHLKEGLSKYGGKS